MTNGCSLSAGLLEILTPTKTMIEESESERVCQASAIIAMEPVTIPAQYLKPNRRMFTTMESHPSK